MVLGVEPRQIREGPRIAGRDALVEGIDAPVDLALQELRLLARGDDRPGGQVPIVTRRWRRETVWSSTKRFAPAAEMQSANPWRSSSNR